MNIMKKAFSLIELSIVIIVISLLIFGIFKSNNLIANVKLTSAQNITRNSNINNIKNLRVWLEPTLPESIIGVDNGFDKIDGEKISSWNDSKLDVDKINVTQTNTINMPIYESKGISNLPSLRFDNDANKNLSSTKVPISAGDRTYTMVAVFRPTNLDAGWNRTIVSQGSSSSDDKQASIFYWYDKTFGIMLSESLTMTPLKIYVENNYITIAKFNTDKSKFSIYLNSNSPELITDIDTGSFDISTDVFRIASVSFSQWFFKGHISEILVFDRDLRQDEIEKINSYLSKKYSIDLVA